MLTNLCGNGTKPKPKWDVHLRYIGGRAWILAETFRPWIAGRCGQRLLTSSFRRDSPVKKLPTLSCTVTLVPRQRFPVASSLAHPQMASSPLKSGLYPGRFTSRNPSPRVRRYSLSASPRCAGALSQITFNGPGCFSLSCSRKAVDVPELLLPSSSIHSTSPLSRHTADPGSWTRWVPWFAPWMGAGYGLGT